MFAYNVYEKQKRESYREALYMFFLIKRSTNYAITQQPKMDDTNTGYYSSSNWYQLDGDSDKFFCGMGFAKKMAPGLYPTWAIVRNLTSTYTKVLRGQM